jgi:hypothetical protein
VCGWTSSSAAAAAAVVVVGSAVAWPAALKLTLGRVGMREDEAEAVMGRGWVVLVASDDALRLGRLETRGAVSLATTAVATLRREVTAGLAAAVDGFVVTLEVVEVEPLLLRRDEVDEFSFPTGSAVSEEDDDVDVFNEDVEELSLIELRRDDGETSFKRHEACADETLARSRLTAAVDVDVVSLEMDAADEALVACGEAPLRSPDVVGALRGRALAGRLDRFFASSLARWVAVVADRTFVSM